MRTMPPSGGIVFSVSEKFPALLTVIPAKAGIQSNTRAKHTKSLVGMTNEDQFVATQVLQLSTTNVDASGKSLWTTRIANFAINHLAHGDETLRMNCAQFSTAIVESIR